MSKQEKKAKELIQKAEQDLNTKNIKQAKKKLQQAIKIAKKTESEQLINKILKSKTGKYFIYTTKTHSIKLTPIETDGLILDIGGGGEGIIGKLNGKQVVAIDTSEQELLGTQNQALKIVMDATDLKFLPKSFDVCTSFFCLMYMPHQRHSRLFREVYKVLKDNGKFLIWDVESPKKHRDYLAFLLQLKVNLPDEEIEAGYGTEWDRLISLEHFKEVARKTKFKITSKWSKDEIFHLEMSKM